MVTTRRSVVRTRFSTSDRPGSWNGIEPAATCSTTSALMSNNATDAATIGQHHTEGETHMSTPSDHDDITCEQFDPPTCPTTRREPTWMAGRRAQPERKH